MTTFKLLPLVLFVGCFNRPSAEFECSVTAECDDGRQCVSGYCAYTNVVPDSTTPGDSDDPCSAFESRHFDACMLMQPSGALALNAGTYSYDTTTGVLLDPNLAQLAHTSELVGDYRVVSVQSFSLIAGGDLRVTGMYPLVIASWDTLTVDGKINVASTQGSRGAGSNPTAGCANHLAAVGTNGSGGGGAGGGSLQSAGGSGGRGNNANGGAGGTAVTPAPLLVGGCNGATGGTGNGNQTGGDGGNGGGAVQLTARTSITVGATARIDAGGAGGRPGPGSAGGGGGGGSGGMIGFEAPSVTVAAGAVIAANGGGGGQGGGNEGGTPAAGQDAQLSATAAIGGRTGSGGFGGTGSISATKGGDGDNDGAGGGGGGGGAGFITVKSSSPSTNGTFSPAVTLVP